MKFHSSIVLVFLGSIAFSGCGRENQETPKTTLTSSSIQIRTNLVQKEAKVLLGGEQVDAKWYIPAQPPKAWILLQHGFMRNKNHMSSLAETLATRGYLVLTPTLSTTQLNDIKFTEKLAHDLVSNPPQMENGVLPPAFIISGHSLGGLFAVHVASILADQPDSWFRGALLLDPVEKNDRIDAAMKKLAHRKPVYGIVGKPGSCNSNGNSVKEFEHLDTSFRGIRLDKGSHCDAELDSSDWTCSSMCGKSEPRNKDLLREFASNWIDALESADPANSTAAFFPGGARYEELVNKKQIQPF